MNELARLFLLACLTLAALVLSQSGVAPARADTNAVTNPILFVTQVPIQADFTTIASVFGNHRADIDSVGRGGDLYIRYPDGTLKNLTQAAGYGVASGFQGANAIAVRDPSVHWSGTKALFSMAIGAPTQQYDYNDYYFQMYEVTGLGKNDTPVITKIPNQPANVNNITPIYGTDERIIFSSDRPRDGSAHLYPQLDEYEEQPIVSGLWSLDRNSGNLFLMTHTPSGAFTPMIDSYGRVVFTRWDHLQRDQQADADRAAGAGYDSYGQGEGCPAYCTFNYAGEAANAQKLASRDEIFPEPRADDQTQGTNLNTHTFNAFTPWQIHEDGTGEETLNHLGRHELNGYIPASLNDDPNLVEYYGQYSRANLNDITNFLQVRQDPTAPGRYFGIDAPEFYTHASGQLISINAGPNVNPDTSVITYWTHPDTASYTDNPTANHSGHYRDPLPLTSGTVVVAHTTETKGAGADDADYAFRLKTLVQLPNTYWGAGTPLTNGITKNIWWWSPDVRIDFNGEMWELQPVEVTTHAKPERLVSELPDQEKIAIENAGVQLSQIQTWMVQNNLALLVSRDVTQRDDFDKQQPFNLRVPNGKATLGAGGKVYDVKYMQLFQGDLIRGVGGHQDPREGRRILSQLLHDPAAVNANDLAVAQPSSIRVAPDGSVAAFVPARRAMTWQTTDTGGIGVVRERMWITFQPGEIRVCSSCHGVNNEDQAGNEPAANVPQALTELMTHWKNNNGSACSAKPSAPAPTSPGSTTTIPRRRAKLEWDAVNCATKYQIMIREGSPQGPRVEKNKNVLATKYKTIKLAPATTYAWRVNACNAFGCAKSGWQTFTTPSITP